MSSHSEDRVHFTVPYKGAGRGKLRIGDISSKLGEVNAATGEWDAFIMRDKKGEVFQLVAMSRWLSDVMYEHGRFEEYQKLLDDDLAMIVGMQNGFIENLQQLKFYVNSSIEMCELEEKRDTLKSGVYGIMTEGGEYSIKDSIDDDGNPTMYADENGAIAGLFASKIKVVFSKNRLTGEVEGITVSKE